MSEPKLLIRRQGETVWLTLNRPEVGNVIDQDAADALLNAAHKCDSDRSVRWES